MGRVGDQPRGDRSGVTGPNTRIVHAGRNRDWTHGRSGTRGVVNTPVYRASTVLFDSLAELDAANAAPDYGLNYGARGTPSQWALEEALTELDPVRPGPAFTRPASLHWRSHC